MKKKIWVLVIVIGIIIMLRTIFDSNKNLIYIVAGINIVAIVFVIYTIIEKIVYNVIKIICHILVLQSLGQKNLRQPRMN